MSVKCKSYTLRDEGGAWLGQVLLSSDGMFSAVTDWGNFAFVWRSFGSDGDFRKFLISLNAPYFGGKMYLSNADIWGTQKKAMQSCDRFAEKILPALQSVLKNELELGMGWVIEEIEASNV